MSARIAVIGGDKRSERLTWPSGYDVRFYDADSVHRLIDAHHADPFGVVVLMSRFNAHVTQKSLRRAGVKLHLWSQGFGKLAESSPRLPQSTASRRLRHQQ